MDKQRKSPGCRPGPATLILTVSNAHLTGTGTLGASPLNSNINTPGLRPRPAPYSLCLPKESKQRKGALFLALRVPCTTVMQGALAKLACGSNIPRLIALNPFRFGCVPREEVLSTELRTPNFPPPLPPLKRSRYLTIERGMSEARRASFASASNICAA